MTVQVPFQCFFSKKTRTLMPLREMMTPNHLTRFVNLTPTLATPLQKENVLVMSKKRVGSRLRNVKSQYKGKKLSDSKGIGGGKGRLTNKVMNAHPKLIWNVNSPKHS